jgi:hypothetical protein
MLSTGLADVKSEAGDNATHRLPADKTFSVGQRF